MGMTGFAGVRLEQCHGLGMPTLGHQDLRPTEGSVGVNPQIPRTLERKRGFFQTVRLQQPGPSPEPGRRVVSIDGSRAFQSQERSFVVAFLRQEQRAKIWPAEIARVQRLGLFVGSARSIGEAVDLIRHRQSSTHHARFRHDASLPDQFLEEFRKLRVRRVDPRDDWLCCRIETRIRTGA